MASPWFDESLPRLIRELNGLTDPGDLEAGTMLRDASGRLSVFLARAPKNDGERSILSEAIMSKLGPYARSDRPIGFLGDDGTGSVLRSPDRMTFSVDNMPYQLVDRRIVGAGWLEAPVSAHPHPPRVVFATLKGGVGRSTALAVAATDFARRNKNVLVVDLDLEAPGLGDLLLDADRVPEFGAIDYLVESGIGGVPASCLRDFVGASGLTAADGGRVDVLPALGRRSLDCPDNVLPKLSRAMIDDIFENEVVPISQKISDMISRMTAAYDYDLVLIDSRAGLSELAAPAVLGLGATVLMFGTAQKQTIQGYRILFAALRMLAQRDVVQGRDSEWRTKLRPVYAKASLDAAVSERFIDEMYELFSEYLYDAERVGEEAAEALRFARDDHSAPHWPLMVPFNQSFVDFDPVRTSNQLTEPFYEQTYRSFLVGLEAAVWQEETMGGSRA